MASWIIFICLLITLSLIPWKMNQNKKGFPFFRFQVFKSKRFYGTVLHNKISWLSSQINKSWSTLSLSWSSFSSGVSYSLVSFTFQRFHRTFNEFSQIFLQTGARLGSDIAVTRVKGWEACQILHIFQIIEFECPGTGALCREVFISLLKRRHKMCGKGLDKD